MFAAKTGHLDVVTTLVRYGADIRVTNDVSVVPIYHNFIIIICNVYIIIL
jgi:hypothetical protein